MLSISAQGVASCVRISKQPKPLSLRPADAPEGKSQPDVRSSIGGGEQPGRGEIEADEAFEVVAPPPSMIPVAPSPAMQA